MFEVQVDPQKNRIVVALTGFASIDDVRQFEYDLRHAYSMLPTHKGHHQLLYDVSGAMIQAQAVVEALRDLAIHSPPKSAFALVNASALAGRQLGRIFSGINHHSSMDRRDAENWLDGQLKKPPLSSLPRGNREHFP
jgi:hypothetical protein